MARLVKDSHPIFSYTMEGPDNLSAHIRSILTKMDLSFPIIDDYPELGNLAGHLVVWASQPLPPAGDGDLVWRARNTQ